MNITEFLRARIAEDEAVARAATRGPWKWDDHRVPTLSGRAGDPEIYEYDAEVLEATHSGECACRSLCTLELEVGPHDRAHIVRHDPSRVLAECAAKRVVLELHRLYIHADAEPGFSMTMWECMCNRQTGKPCPTIGALAAVYADHPDYRKEWVL